MSPPLTVSEEEMATGLRIFAESVAIVAGEHAGHREHGAVFDAATAAGAMHEVEAAG
jgi:hypothetical protein